MGPNRVRAGIILANASENISISGTLKDGTPGGVFSRTIGTDRSGLGDHRVGGGQNFTLSDGATVSASSSGSGNAGDINITGLTRF